MAMRVFCTPNWHALEEAAIGAWQKCGGNAIIIVPSATMRRWLLSQLAAKLGGIHGNAVVTLERFSEKIAQNCAQTPFRLASHHELRLAAWDALHSCDVPEQWHVSGVVDAFLDAVEEMELHGLKPEDVAQALAHDRNIVHLTELWKHWREALHKRNLWTVGDVLNHGIEAVEHLQGELPSEVIAYGFTALTDLRWKFLQALQNAGVQTMKFFVPTLLGNEQAYRYAQGLLKLLKSQGAEICRVYGGDLPDELKCLAQSAFRWQQGQETRQETDRILCIAAAGEEQEVEMAIRVLTQWLREGKLQRYSDALLFVRSLDGYLPALEAVSARYGIPLLLLSESGQPAYGLQRLLNALAEASRQGLSGEKLWQILPSPYLQIGGKPLLPAERHREMLQRIRRSIAETDTEHWVRILALDGQFAKNLREFLHAVAELPKEAPASEHARAWRKLLDKFVAPVNGDEKENEAIKGIRGALNSLMSWETSLTLDEVVNLLTDACRLPTRIFSDAIRVATVSEGRGLWAQVTILLGLNDDEFPQTPSQFELLNDEHRKELQRTFKLLTPLKLRSQLLTAERMLFMEVIGSATDRLVLTYKRTDAEGKPQAASVFLSAVENALHASGWQWRYEERDLGDVLPRNLSEAIDQRDAEKGAIYAAFSGAQLAEDEMALTAQVLRDESFRIRLLTEWQRWEKPQQGSWDGNISSLSSQIVEYLRENGLRVTALETYGHCPYKFFARHILGLERPRDVTYTIDRRTIGNLWHEIMEKFLKEWQEKGSFPDEQTLCETVGSVAAGRLADYPDIVRELMLQQILAVARQIWIAEMELQKGWRPLGAEVSLKFESEKLGDMPEPLRKVIISLKIDRIDENQHGQLRIADYKTGSPPSRSDIQNGTALQLPLYAFAVQFSDKFAGKQVLEALFLRLFRFTKNGGYSTACHLTVQPKGQQLPLSEMQQIAINWAKQFLESMANADFTVRPFDFGSSCRGCDFKAMCRQSKLRLVERRHQQSDKGQGNQHRRGR